MDPRGSILGLILFLSNVFIYHAQELELEYQGLCPKGFESRDQGCYKKINAGASFDDALETCKSLKNAKHVDETEHVCDISGLMTLNDLRNFKSHSKHPGYATDTQVRLNAFFFNGRWWSKCVHDSSKAVKKSLRSFARNGVAEVFGFEELFPDFNSTIAKNGQTLVYDPKSKELKVRSNSKKIPFICYHEREEVDGDQGCGETLNSCNGNGKCLMGKCYCFEGPYQGSACKKAEEVTVLVRNGCTNEPIDGIFIQYSGPSYDDGIDSYPSFSGSAYSTLQPLSIGRYLRGRDITIVASDGFDRTSNMTTFVIPHEAAEIEMIIYDKVHVLGQVISNETGEELVGTSARLYSSGNFGTIDITRNVKQYDDTFYFGRLLPFTTAAITGSLSYYISKTQNAVIAPCVNNTLVVDIKPFAHLTIRLIDEGTELPMPGWNVTWKINNYLEVWDITDGNGEIYVGQVPYNANYQVCFDDSGSSMYYDSCKNGQMGDANFTQELIAQVEPHIIVNLVNVDDNTPVDSIDLALYQNFTESLSQYPNINYRPSDSNGQVIFKPNWDDSSAGVVIDFNDLYNNQLVYLESTDETVDLSVDYDNITLTLNIGNWPSFTVLALDCTTNQPVADFPVTIDPFYESSSSGTTDANGLYTAPLLEPYQTIDYSANTGGTYPTGYSSDGTGSKYIGNRNSSRILATNPDMAGDVIRITLQWDSDKDLDLRVVGINFRTRSRDCIIFGDGRCPHGRSITGDIESGQDGVETIELVNEDDYGYLVAIEDYSGSGGTFNSNAQISIWYDGNFNSYTAPTGTKNKYWVLMCFKFENDGTFTDTRPNFYTTSGLDYQDDDCYDWLYPTTPAPLGP